MATSRSTPLIHYTNHQTKKTHTSLMASSSTLSFFTHLTPTTTPHFLHQQQTNNQKTSLFFSLKTPQISSTKLTILPFSQTPPLTLFTPKISMSQTNSHKGNSGNFEIFDTEEDVAVSLAKYAADLSDKFVKQRDAFTVVVSGGSLIKSLRKLVEEPYLSTIEWSKWHIFWVDERVVPKVHPESNYKLAFDGFLSKVPIPPENVHAINDTLSTEEAAEDYEARLKQLVQSNILATSQTTGFPKFDAMLLGMGPDGHVASLFPGHPLVNEDKKWVTFIKDSPKPPPERITLTFPVINSSAHIALAIIGAGKAGIVKTALGDGDQSSNVLPVQLVSPEGELKWFLDKDAASLL